MANKQVKYTFLGVNQDMTKSKHPAEFYYNANHITLTSTDSQTAGSINNERGNKKVISIPSVFIKPSSFEIKYGTKTIVYKPSNELITQLFPTGVTNNLEVKDNIIIGHVNSREGIVLFTTNEQGIDIIWHINNVLDGEYNLELVYIRKLGFSINNPIQALYNYENENVQKVYWIDGKAQTRFINITNDLLEDNEKIIEAPSTSLNFVSQVNYTQPIIQSLSSGGSHTAGMVQYAYNLFRLYGSQTKISPLSELVPLGKGSGLGGGEINEVVGTAPVVVINGLDPRYTHIKIYAIKYTSKDQIPSISLIDEREFAGTSVTILDDGSTIDALSLEQFIFLGSEPSVPKHIETKDNRLISANISTKSFVLPDEFDFRAYSFPKNLYRTKVINDITAVNGNNDATGTEEVTITDTYNLRKKHSAANPNYETYHYQLGTRIPGGSGKLLKYEIRQVTEAQLGGLTNQKVEDLKFFKDNELYRIGILLKNELGQDSEPHWISDFKTDEGNLVGKYNTLDVTLNAAFTAQVNLYNQANPDAKIIGYRILRADRKIKDKTIIQQGIVSTMVQQNKDITYLQTHKNPDPNLSNDSSLKFPSWLIRHYNNYPQYNNSNNLPDYEVDKTGGWLIRNAHNAGLASEVYTGKGKDSKRQYSFVYDKMMQMFNPEITFGEISELSNGLRVRVKGSANLTNAYTWIEERDIGNKRQKHSGKVKNAINYHRRALTGGVVLEDNDIYKAAQTPDDDDGGGTQGFVNPSGGKDTMNFRLFYREYNKFTPAPIKYEEEIYGKPEMVERGRGDDSYNKDSKFRYSNNLQSLMSDTGDKREGKIIGITHSNSYAERNITYVLGNNREIASNNRTGSTDLFNRSKLSSQSTTKNSILVVEIKKPRQLEYLGNIYGGNRYEEKKRTEYIQIGEYNKISSLNTFVISPGDTFVQNFKLQRIGKTDTEEYSNDSIQITEIITYNIETTIDLKNRNDSSFGVWDSIFQPQFDDFAEYNKVYSQQSRLVKNQSADYKFNIVNNFTTRIQSSKAKIPNESIDNWTDTLENEVMDLDNSYGPINGFVSFKDNIYAFQDNGISSILINPRVQIQSDDGVGLELGTGKVLDDYKYLTTKSGSINKWGIAVGKKGIYYYDAHNRAIGRVPDAVDFMLTDLKGLHSFHNRNFIFSDLKVDNPLLKKGVLFGVDDYNNNLYFTLHQDRDNQDPAFNYYKDVDQIVKPTTWCYNEIMDRFIDMKPGYEAPSHFIGKGDKFLMSKDNKEIYETGKGKHNEFYGKMYPSIITLMINPESDVECVFDNIHYNSEVYLNDVDQPHKTLTDIRAWNEYQDSGKIPLIVGRGTNIRRKFREWQANIPRMGRDRIRNPWIYLQLSFDNESGYKLILHDIIIQYTV